MKQINKEILKEASEKLLFEMSDDEYDTLLKEFEIILHQFELIKNIEGVDELTPMAFPFEVDNTYLREDVINKKLERDEILKNSEDVVDGQIRLPKVVR